MSDAALLLTPPAVAKLLAVSPDKVRALIRAGELAAIDLSVRPGRRKWRHLRIRAQALEEFLARREGLTAPTPRTAPRRRQRQSEKESGFVRYY